MMLLMSETPGNHDSRLTTENQDTLPATAGRLKNCLCCIQIFHVHTTFTTIPIWLCMSCQHIHVLKKRCSSEYFG